MVVSAVNGMKIDVKIKKFPIRYAPQPLYLSCLHISKLMWILELINFILVINVSMLFHWLVCGLVPVNVPMLEGRYAQLIILFNLSMG